MWLARLAVVLCLLNILFLLPSILYQLAGLSLSTWELRRHFEPDAEANLFTWYSSFLLLLLAGAAIGNYMMERGVARPSFPSGGVVWIGLAALSVALSIEEVAGIHESIDRSFQAQHWLDPWLAKSWRSWVIVYSPFIVGAAAYCVYIVRLAFPLGRRGRNFAFIGISLWMAVPVLEFLTHYIMRDWGVQYLVWEIIIEEGLELFGTSFLLLACLNRIRDGLGEGIR